MFLILIQILLKEYADDINVEEE